MRGILVIISLLFSCISIPAQTFDLNLSATMLRNNDVWKKGTNVKIINFSHEYEYNQYGKNIDVFYLVDDKNNIVDISSKVKDCFDFKYENVQQLWDANIVTNVLYQLKKNGFQYEMRREMEDDALDYIQKIRSYNLELNDPYLNMYIYSLVAKIAPTQLIDGRPGSVNLIIQQNPSINSCCYPNGTIVINTGLLSVLHTEAELVAILAHEIAHFILDHSVQNVNETIKRQKRAEFWASLATGITAVAEVAIAAKSNYYVPGAATIGMAVLSSSIASQVNERLGMNYNHEQEKEADELAVQVLKILGYDENALATALSRILIEYEKERNNVVYFSSYTHPSLIDRILNIGIPNESKDVEFERIISFAVSDVAMMKYNDCRFRQCLPYVSQNIVNGVATADDYILKANCLLRTSNDSSSNNEVFELIQGAKLRDKENINIYKVEILATLRMKNYDKAKELLLLYIEKLRSIDISHIVSSETWDNLNEFKSSEISWASKMLVKLQTMK